jgi:putative ABC transport system permease protein
VDRELRRDRGSRIRFPSLETWPDPVRDPVFEVIGVASDIKNQGLRQPASPDAWIPYTITGSYFRGLLIRTTQNPLAMSNAVRKEIWAIEPNVASTINRTLEDFIEQYQYAQPRFALVIVSIFAGLGMVLAAVGVYGVISYTTERQTQEIGIRMALGADRDRVLWLVILMGVRLIALGAGIGLLMTIGLSRFMQSQLIEVSPYDPLTLSMVTLVLLLTGIVACWVPALRATRIDPAIALRYE